MRALCLLGGLAAWLSALPNAGAQPSHAPLGEPQILERGPHHRAFGTITCRTNAAGRVLARTNTAYVEVASGLHFQRAGRWLETDERLQAVPGGALVTNAPHQVWLPANIFEGYIEVRTDRGAVRTRPVGAAYVEGSNCVWISELQPSLGQILPPGNRLIYTNAFTDGSDLLCTVRKSGFECDVIFRTNPPSPAAWGLAAADTRLQVVTELLDTQDPVQKGLAVDPEDQLADRELHFQDIAMKRGQAFLTDGSLCFGSLPAPGGGAVPRGAPHPSRVYKSIESYGSRRFLTEELPYSRVERQLLELSALPQSKDLLAGKGAVLGKVSPQRLLPPRRPAGRAGTNQVLWAKLDLRRPGFVWDYVEITGTTNSYEFRNDTTYLVSDRFSVDVARFSPGAVIKFSTNTLAQIEVNERVDFGSVPSRVLFTAADDNTAGDPIANSTGMPVFGGYGGSAVVLPLGTNNAADFRSARFCFLRMALNCEAGGQINLSDLQFVNCQYPVAAAGGSLRLFNALVCGAGTVLYGSCQAAIINSTLHRVGTLSDDFPLDNTALALTNSLLVQVTNLGSYASLATNQTRFLDSDAGVFQSAGAGAHYLAEGSPHRAAGVSEIASNELAFLRARTTWPPVVLSNVTVAGDVTLVPQAPRDTGPALDLGVHYVPLDYVAYVFAITNGTVSVSNGAVIAFYDYPGIWLQDGAVFVSAGSPLALNRLLDYRIAQEQPLKLGQYPGNSSGLPIFPRRLSGVAGSATVRFTEFARLAGNVDSSFNLYVEPGSGWMFGDLSVKDCSFHNGAIRLMGTNTSFDFKLNNSLLESCNLEMYGTCEAAIYNNLLHRNWTWFEPYGSNPWLVRDNAFDSGYVADYFGYYPVTHDHNALISQAADWAENNPADLVLSNFTYATGPLGPYYQVSTNLYDAGSRTAAAAGLFHYTVRTNNVKEGSGSPGTVDIGLHYVALDSAGNPVDSDADGMPDVSEDANGNGLVDSGETDWQSATDLGLKVLITRPKANSSLP